MMEIRRHARIRALYSPRRHAPAQPRQHAPFYAVAIRQTTIFQPPAGAGVGAPAQRSRTNARRAAWCSALPAVATWRRANGAQRYVCRQTNWHRHFSPPSSKWRGPARSRARTVIAAFRLEPVTRNSRVIRQCCNSPIRKRPSGAHLKRHVRSRMPWATKCRQPLRWLQTPPNCRRLRAAAFGNKELKAEIAPTTPGGSRFPSPVAGGDSAASAAKIADYRLSPSPRQNPLETGPRPLSTRRRDRQVRGSGKPDQFAATRAGACRPGRGIGLVGRGCGTLDREMVARGASVHPLPG